MIDIADSNAVYYYHYDGSGSVVALSDSYGNSCQSYEYSAFGQVAASDPNFTANPYMFTGRRFDYETGLYYYRARYYNPYIGRFLQTDPVGYGDGMNLYAYCGNNPLGCTDPSGLASITVPIPIGAIADELNMSTYWCEVEWWLTDVGFFDEYEGWTIENIEIDGDYFQVDLESPPDVCDVPNFQFYQWSNFFYYGTLDGIGLLDSKDRTLNKIIKDSFHEMNKQRRPLFPTFLPTQFDEFKIGDLANKLFGAKQTPFKSIYPQKFRYKGKVYDGDDINYILMGHGMKHQKVAHYLGVTLAILYKGGKYGHASIPDTLYWFTKGYGEYGTRSGW